MADTKRPSEIRLQDPLSDVTRAERKTLLGLSAVGLVIARSGLVPSRISALGIEFDRADQECSSRDAGRNNRVFCRGIRRVTRRLTLLPGEYHFGMPFCSSQREYEAQTDDQRALEDRLRQRLHGQWLVSASRSVSVTRAIFEFVVPFVIAVFAVVSLAASRPPNTTASSGQVKPSPITVQTNKPLPVTSAEGK